MQIEAMAGSDDESHEPDLADEDFDMIHSSDEEEEVEAEQTRRWEDDIFEAEGDTEIDVESSIQDHHEITEHSSSQSSTVSSTCSESASDANTVEIDEDADLLDF